MIRRLEESSGNVLGWEVAGKVTEQEETRDLRREPPSKSLGETLGEMLDGMRRQPKDDLAAAKRLDLPRVDRPGVSRLRKAKQS